MFSRPAQRKPNIDCDVNDNDRGSKHELNLAGQARRIDDVEQVVLDEAFRVARLTGADTKVVLDIGEGADATGKLCEERPSRHRKMNKWHPAPARGECPAEKGK